MKKKKSNTMIHFLFLILFALSHSAYSQDNADLAEVSHWKYELSFTLTSIPLYEGDDQNGFAIFPNFKGTYKNNLSVSPLGISYKFFDSQWFESQATTRFRFGRSSGKSSNPFFISGRTNDLEGLDDLKTTIEGGVGFKVKYYIISFSANLNKGFGGHNSTLADLTLSYIGFAKNYLYTISYQESFAQEGYVNAYFGVDAAESAASGLAVYDGKGGRTSSSTRVMIIFKNMQPWALSSFVEYKVLHAPMSNSSLVKQRGSRYQNVIGLSVSKNY